MSRPLIGITCCSKPFGPYAMLNHAASDTYVRATDTLVSGIPVLIPANGDRVECASLLEHLGGLILTGSRSNIRPEFYAGPPHPEGTPEDPARDRCTFRLIRAAIARGIPVLAICRGMQEVNVALGGSLHQRLKDLPGRLDHGTPMQPHADLRQGKAHRVTVEPGSWLWSVAAGRSSIAVNSLHEQGIDRLAEGLVVEGRAPDGTIEAVRVVSTLAGPVSSFAIGLQWHPEYDCEADAVSRRIFEAFGAACKAASAASLAPRLKSLAGD